MNEIVVIGYGQAAVQAVMSLKRNEFSGSIKIIGEEGLTKTEGDVILLENDVCFTPFS